MLKIRYTTKFKKDLKKVKKRPQSGYDESEFKECVINLANRHT